MKKFSVLLASLAIFSCQKTPKDYMVLSGTVTNPNTENVLVSGHGLREKLPLTADGTFSDTLKIKEPGYYTLRIGKESSTFYLANGGDIDLTIDTKLFDETLKYTGEGAAENNYLAAKYLSNEELTANQKEFYSLDEKAFVAKVDSIEKAYKDKLDDADVSDEFEALETKNLKYDTYTYLNYYQRAYPHYTGNPEYTPSETITSYKSEIDYDNDADAKAYSNYAGLVISDFYAKTNALENEDSLKYKTIELLKAKKSPVLQQKIMDELAFEIRPGNMEIAPYYFDEFMELSTDEAFKENLIVQYELFKKLIAGAPSPTFKNYESIDRKEMSLADFKGKYVYIDVWATWCGPCKREIPYLKQVEEQFKDKNIEFVGISVDVKADKNTWRTFVEENELVGTQLFADKDWSSDFMVEYGVQYIPRFILIDTEGNIINAAAPNPSSGEELTDLLSSLENI
ncbi:TlpA family protein disulfide reductase [Neptunitalea lumnitzerae]|nr:TlpA disulfide reductase family protein [Neptunitalea sp. Y10]